jgi:hypothetical protein
MCWRRLELGGVPDLENATPNLEQAGKPVEEAAEVTWFS